MTGRIGVVGLSHLGAVASACLASTGLDVTAVDTDATLVAAMAAGQPPIHEPGLADLLAARRPAFTTDYAALAGCALVIIAADTVTDDDNRADLSALEAHVERALPFLPRDGAVALMSQVPVGYTRELAARLRARRPELEPRLYYWVETLVIGEALARYLEPERIIIGGQSDRPGPDRALDALLSRFRCPVFRMNYESAELVKAAINFYLATSLTFANTLADLCEVTGASIRAMLPALRTDRRIGPHAYIRPGLGIGGGNLERDLVHLRTLVDKHALDGALPRLILEASATRYGWLLQALDRHVLSRGSWPRLAVWGLAYKRNTRSTKNSVGVRLVHDLAARATLVVYDPQAALPATPDGVLVAKSPLQAAAGADGLTILTDWEEFRAVDAPALLAALGRPVVVDAAAVLDPEGARAAGLTYVAIGEPA